MYDDLTDEQQKKARELGFTFIFAERESVVEAINYSFHLIDSKCFDYKPEALTALYVVINTFAVALAKEA